MIEIKLNATETIGSLVSSLVSLLTTEDLAILVKQLIDAGLNQPGFMDILRSYMDVDIEQLVGDLKANGYVAQMEVDGSGDAIRNIRCPHCLHTNQLTKADQMWFRAHRDAIGSQPLVLVCPECQNKFTVTISTVDELLHEVEPAAVSDEGMN